MVSKTRKRVTTELKSWLDDVAAYEKKFQEWESRCGKIVKRYRDDYRGASEHRNYEDGARFNILWSNVQTLMAATFARLPKPDVSRRFNDNDPIGRIASLMLERALDYEVQHYPDFRMTLKQCVQDRFITARGTSWVRYEPRFKDAGDDAEVTEDVEQDEALDYECAPTDYVYWRDFGHSAGRTWEEVNRVWRRVYMPKAALEDRFGKEKAAQIPMDAAGTDDMMHQYRPSDAVTRATIYEGWDKERGVAVWFSKGVKEFLDERADPLELDEFFPCPRPLYGTLTSDTLVPIPDYAIYQDQAEELNVLQERIDGLVKALKVRGVYDASVSELARLFSEGSNNSLIPVKNWKAFVEKNGLQGAIDLIDIKPFADALLSCYEAKKQITESIYELTGISDIVRGQTIASETATAQQIKGQYASLRLKTYQEQVALYASELLQIKAQIICNKFSPETILTISAADQLNVSDTDVLAVSPQLGVAPPAIPGMPPSPPPIAMMQPQEKKQIVLQAALQLLIGPRLQNPELSGANPLRSFRVEVASDSLVYLDENQEKQSRMEFLTTQGAFMGQLEKLLISAGPMAPALAPVALEMWKFGATAFRVGRNIEGLIDEAAEKIKQISANPPKPAPDPKLLTAQSKLQIAPIEAQAEMTRAQASMVDSQARVIESRNKLRQAQFEATMPQPGPLQ